MHEMGMVQPSLILLTSSFQFLIFLPQSTVSILVLPSVCIYLIYNTTFTIKMFIGPKTWFMELFYDVSRWVRIILN